MKIEKGFRVRNWHMLLIPLLSRGAAHHLLWFTTFSHRRPSPWSTVIVTSSYFCSSSTNLLLDLSLPFPMNQHRCSPISGSSPWRWCSRSLHLHRRFNRPSSPYFRDGHNLFNSLWICLSTLFSYFFWIALALMMLRQMMKRDESN